MKTSQTILASAVAITIAMASTTHARLGDTLTQARARYGQEFRSEKGTNGGIAYISFHRKDPMQIELRFSEHGPGDTKVIEIVYTKIDKSPFTWDEVQYLVEANAQDFKWSDLQDSLATIHWKRSDGAQASYDKSTHELGIADVERIKYLEAPPESLKDF